MDCLRCRTSNVIASRRRSNLFSIIKKLVPNSYFLILNLLSSLIALTACSDFFEPVDSTSAPTEYSYNYWLLQHTYLFEDELSGLEEGDSVQQLYASLSDPYTRYIPPSKSEQAVVSINTSIIPGNVGMEYSLFPNRKYPLVIERVYPNGPAGRAGVPRHGNILNVNGVEITGENAKAVYDSVLNYNKDISMTVANLGDTLLYEFEKEDVYAPTVFVDTVAGYIVITIKNFKLNTADRENGTYGELKAYLDSTRNYEGPRLIDLRNNPGGHVEKCTAMADLFIEDGIITVESIRSFDALGGTVVRKNPIRASSGDAGEGKKFAVLVNRGSASCSEIFTSAIQESAGIPVVGVETYGKGIGQSSWYTPAGGLAIITNLEFLTPKGNSYHKKGIEPDYRCDSVVTIQCGLAALQQLYGSPSLNASQVIDVEERNVLREIEMGGAIVQGDPIDFVF